MENTKGLAFLEPNKLYGSFERGNAVEFLFEEGRLHEAAFISKVTIGHLLDFGMNAVGIENVPNYISADNQVWAAKDYLGLFGMLSFGWFIVILAIYIAKTVPAFAVVNQPLPRNIGLRKIGLAISIVCGIGFPFIVLKTGSFGILTKMGSVQIACVKIEVSECIIHVPLPDAVLPCRVCTDSIYALRACSPDA